MTRTTLRKLQLSCFGLVHVPLIAVAAFALPKGQLGLVGVALVATLVTAIMVWGVIHRTLGRGTAAA
ncbi:hypothetical protein [Roseivivax sediminis]|uniref:Uncharacterized protein n=1 Tax=Roseivivax sediminis TaxID=936889 RepID=A0A1I1VXV0_9RHOB|nr:hypothetical protein [Roseivivax sediminis]SFD87731.1 hypothetical protein SAMN04515678_1042 [Roseivivax sediminis]